MLTSEQLDQFGAVAARMHEDVPDVLEEIRKLVAQAAGARAEVSAILQAGGYEEVLPAHGAALDGVLDVVSHIGSLTPTPAETIHAQGATPPTTNVHLVVPSQDAIALDVAMLRFYTASACTTVCDLLDAYVQISETFLGRRTGAKKIGRRTGNVFAAAFKEIFVPPGVETVLEAIRQFVTSPLDEDIARMQKAKAQNARAAALRDALGHLREQTSFLGEIVRIAVDGATDARAWLDEAGAAYAKALQVSPPDTNAG